VIGVAKGMGSPKAKYAGKKLSAVGTKTSGGLACPNCGSTSFESKRSAGGKLAGGLLAPKTRVKCVACGVEFVRG
jgi:DNA-directed RNA polymerase subunit RPC12/RpoP